MALPPEIQKPLEGWQGTEASGALRALIWARRRDWLGAVLGSPSAIDERTREYSCGAVAALEELYGDLSRVLQWRPDPPHKAPETNDLNS
jgi:hypothetical protein